MGNKPLRIALLSLFILMMIPTRGMAGPPGQKHWKKGWKSPLSKGVMGHEDRRFGICDGNLIRTRFHNFGSIGGPGDRNKPRLEWPAYSGHEYGYEMGPLIGAEVLSEPDTISYSQGDTLPLKYISHGLAYTTVIDTDSIIIATQVDTILYHRGDTLFPLSPPEVKVLTADVNIPVRFVLHIVDDGIQDGGAEEFEPLPGYANPNPPPEWQGWLAFSDKPATWPPVWPDGTTGWPGQFGEGVIVADQESYWVMTDEANTEYMDKYGPRYYPDPDNPDLHGLGIQVTCRGYQWAATLAEDIIFWVYDIKNISAKDLDKVVVIYFGDFDIGGYPDYPDDAFSFDSVRNIAYTWDTDNESVNFEPGENIGWLGFKLLETPTDSLGNELGLTSATAFIYGLGYAYQDSLMWSLSVPGTYKSLPFGDVVTVFGSGYFSSKVGETKRFSIAVIIGADSTDMFENAEVAQMIYDLDYQFTRAPDKPKLVAVPGDGKVTLYWDTGAEESVDPVLGKDFEGYKIYKGTERNTKNWGNPITDDFGRQVGTIPEAQFDKIDGVKGLFPLEKNGYHFYLGNETGLVHRWTDSNVVNGMKYYYAVTAHDTGCVAMGILPSETPMTLGSPNVVEVVPNAPAAGYQPPEVIDLQHVAGFGTGEFSAAIINPMEIKDGHIYEVTFNDTTTYYTTYSVFDITGTRETLMVNCPWVHGEDAPVFDGISLFIVDEPEVAYDDFSWIQGDASYTVSVIPYPGGIKYPADYEISFYNRVVGTDILGNPVNFQIWNVTDDTLSEFLFTNVGPPDSIVRDNDKIVPIVYENGAPKATWRITFNGPDTLPPGDGDVLLITTRKPFTHKDVFTFSTKEAQMDNEEARLQLDRIAVVPNPYIVAAAWEPEILEPTMAQRAVGTEHDRKLDFIHLPPECTIRIYTITGELVKTIEHNSTVFDGHESWNMLSKDNMEISYGIYIYYVDAPGIGTKIGRFAIIK
ncbi:MAG TPA: hypothetical protein EYP60_01375 [bacterium (Candidatus Stahlbacteria)]|nr:hypothetical protein [Candidatus Stahlbacteria bacterium]